jgi:hypothetical protein
VTSVSREPQRVFFDAPQCILGFTLRLESLIGSSSQRLEST